MQIFMMNLSAPFICEFFKDAQEKVLQYAQCPSLVLNFFLPNNIISRFTACHSFWFQVYGLCFWKRNRSKNILKSSWLGGNDSMSSIGGDLFFHFLDYSSMNLGMICMLFLKYCQFNRAILFRMVPLLAKLTRTAR